MFSRFSSNIAAVPPEPHKPYLNAEFKPRFSGETSYMQAASLGVQGGNGDAIVSKGPRIHGFSLPKTLDFGLASLDVGSIIKLMTSLARKMTQRIAHYVLQTYIPKPVAAVQRAIYKLNELIFLHPALSFLPWHHGRVRFADSKGLERLQALGKQKVGVIIAGAHPELGDGNILAEIHRQAGRFPAFIPFSSEVLSQWGRYIVPEFLFLLKPMFSALGLAPVKRGERSDALKEHGLQCLNDGQWLSLFPEGHIHIGPRVFPMQKGAVEMALKAAVASRFEKPIFIQPFAHNWRYRNPAQMEVNMRKTLDALDWELSETGLNEPLQTRPGQASKANKANKSENPLRPSAKTPSGMAHDLYDQVFTLGNRILEHARQVHDIALPERWKTFDFWDRADYVKEQSLRKLEARYGLPHNEARLINNRVMKIRTKIWQQLANLPQSTLKAQRAVLNHDLQCTSDLNFLYSFTRADLQDYGNGQQLDAEMLSVYVRRLCALAGWKGNSLFGKRAITVELLDPVDMRSYARHYASLATQAEKDRYAAELTETCLQKPIQEAANRLRRLASRPTHI